MSFVLQIVFDFSGEIRQIYLELGGFRTVILPEVLLLCYFLTLQKILHPHLLEKTKTPPGWS